LLGRFYYLALLVELKKRVVAALQILIMYHQEEAVSDYVLLSREILSPAHFTKFPQ
jgi:hypothetical protein